MIRTSAMNGRRLLALGMAATLGLTLAACDDNHHNNGGSTNSPTPTKTSAPATSTPAGGATATRTNTPPPGATATATATPRQSSSENLAKAEAVIASVLPQVLNLTSFGSFAGGTTRSARVGGFPVPCPSGGTLSFECNASGGGSKTTIDFNDCHVSGGGASTLIDGTFSQTVPVACFQAPPANGTISIAFEGHIEATSPVLNEPVSVDFDMEMTLSKDGSNNTRLDFSGTFDDTCVGEVELETKETLVIPPAGDCPTAGRIQVTFSGGRVETIHTSGGGVQIDDGADGSVDKTFSSCRAASAAACD